jgi:hypothetical protein
MLFNYGRKVDARSEDVFVSRLMADRVLFGRWYSMLLPDLFQSLSHTGGVMIRCLVPTGELVPDVVYPGDIDMLVIPYDAGELLLHETLAIEVKVVRASFANQAKSPNKFGISQAPPLLEHGFPHAAVLHVITSDQTPPHFWKETHVTQIIDGTAGTVEPVRAFYTDMMPADLIDRTYGKLKTRCENDLLGLVSCYIGGNGIWEPRVRQAGSNPDTSRKTLEAILHLYESTPGAFFDTPRYDPY